MAFQVLHSRKACNTELNRVSFFMTNLAIKPGKLSPVSDLAGRGVEISCLKNKNT